MRDWSYSNSISTKNDTIWNNNYKVLFNFLIGSKCNTAAWLFGYLNYSNCFQIALHSWLKIKSKFHFTFVFEKCFDYNTTLLAPLLHYSVLCLRCVLEELKLISWKSTVYVYLLVVVSDRLCLRFVYNRYKHKVITTLLI